MPDAATKRYPDFDIHEMKQKLIEVLLNSTSVGFGVCDRELRVQFVNDAWSKMDGVAREDHIGRRVPEILGTAACPVEGAMRRVLESGEPIEGLKFGARIPARPEVAEWVVNLYRFELRGEPHVGSITIDTAAKARFNAYLVAEGRDHRPVPTTAEPLRKHPPLSKRELEITRHLVLGKSNKEIAATVKLSVRTVESYRKTIFRTLNIHCLAELVLYAVSKRLISLPTG